MAWQRWKRSEYYGGAAALGTLKQGQRVKIGRTIGCVLQDSVDSLAAKVRWNNGKVNWVRKSEIMVECDDDSD